MTKSDSALSFIGATLPTPELRNYGNITCLKGKFSSGIEGALASTLNHDFNWKQL